MMRSITVYGKDESQVRPEKMIVCMGVWCCALVVLWLFSTDKNEKVIVTAALYTASCTVISTLIWAVVTGTLSECKQSPRSTQPDHPSVGRRNEYHPKGGDALWLGSKGRYGL